MQPSEIIMVKCSIVAVQPLLETEEEIAKINNILLNYSYGQKIILAITQNFILLHGKLQTRDLKISNLGFIFFPDYYFYD